MKPGHMQTLQDLFRALNQGRCSSNLDGHPELRALIDRRLEAINAAMELVERINETAPSAWRWPGGQWQDGFPTAADHDALEAAGKVPEFAYPHPYQNP